LQVADTTDATKVRKGRDEALALAKTAGKILVAKGKNVVAIDMKDAPDDDTLAGLLLGPSGNLRAPTLRKGKTLYVGFSEEAYRQLGG
jgi:arsenate reductase-like glutaredoxin family protein